MARSPKPRAGSTRRPARRKASPPAKKRRPRAPIAAAEVTPEDLRALRRELERRLNQPAGRRAAARAGRSRGPVRWNPEPEDVQRSVAQLVLTLVEFIRRLMERQAVRRMEANTLTPQEVEAVGQALMQLEDTVREIGARFGLTAEDLNLDLGAIKLM